MVLYLKERVSFISHFARAADNLPIRGDAMSTLTIMLSEDRLAKLQEIADRFNIKTEDLARLSIEELLTRPEESFHQAANHILQKNAELYRRLAQRVISP